MSLEIIMGGMFSGKSTELIRRVHRHKIIGKRILVINSSTDTRSSEDIIKTHDSKCYSCIKVSNLNETQWRDYDVVAIDEVQFFTGLYDFVEHLLHFGKHIILAGLDGDYKQQKFGELFDVIPLADDIIKLHALCMDCKDGTRAPFSKRCSKSTQQELVGDIDIYKAVCRTCL